MNAALPTPTQKSPIAYGSVLLPQLVPPYPSLPSLRTSFLKEERDRRILSPVPRREEGEEEKGHLRYPTHGQAPHNGWKYPNVNHQLAQFRWKGKLYYV